MDEHGRPVRRQLDPIGAREGRRRAEQQQRPQQQATTMAPPAPMAYGPFPQTSDFHFGDPYPQGYAPIQQNGPPTPKCGGFNKLRQVQSPTLLMPVFGGFFGAGQGQKHHGCGVQSQPPVQQAAEDDNFNREHPCRARKENHHGEYVQTPPGRNTVSNRLDGMQEFAEPGLTAFQKMVRSWVHEESQADPNRAFPGGYGKGPSPAEDAFRAQSGGHNHHGALPTKSEHGQYCNSIAPSQSYPGHKGFSEHHETRYSGDDGVFDLSDITGIAEPSTPLPTFDEAMAMAGSNSHPASETQPWDSAMGDHGFAPTMPYHNERKNDEESLWNRQGRGSETGAEEPSWATDFPVREPEPTPATSPAPKRRSSSQRRFPNREHRNDYEFHATRTEARSSAFSNPTPHPNFVPAEFPIHGWQAYCFASTGTCAPLGMPTMTGNNNSQVDPSPTESEFSIESTSDVGYVADASTRLFPIYEEPGDDGLISERELTPIASGRLIEWKPPALTEEEVD